MEDPDFTCVVEGLSSDTTDTGLEDAFSQFGEVVQCTVLPSHGSFVGFVVFASEASMNDAIKGMNGKKLGGRNITVKAQSPRSPGDLRAESDGGKGSEGKGSGDSSKDGSKGPPGNGHSSRWWSRENDHF